MGASGKITRLRTALAVSILVLVAACGGGGDGADDLGERVFGGIDPSSDASGSEGDGGNAGSAEVGPVTQTADPSTGWVEVDGERYEFSALGSTHFRCELLQDRITINFQQTTAQHDFVLQGSIVDGNWLGNFTFAPATEDQQVSYGATLGSDPGTLGIGDQAISYEGTFSRVEDYDIQNAQDVEAKLAVNCEVPGGAPVVEVGGETFSFPFSGAQSVDCSISDDGVEVMISHSSPERLQLQIDVRDNGGQVLGGVFVTSGDDQFNSTMPDDGTGLTIDGNTLSYEGTFSTPGGEEVEGTASVVCG